MSASPRGSMFSLQQLRKNPTRGRKRGRSCLAREAVSGTRLEKVELVAGQLSAATSVRVGLVFVKHPVPAGQTQSDPFLFSF